MAAAITLDPSKRVDIKYHSGTDGSKTFTFTDNAGDAYDISGNTFTLNIKRRDHNSINVLQLTEASGLTKDTSSLVITLTDTQTTDLKGDYYWELLRTDGDGLVKRWLNGYLQETKIFDGLVETTSVVIDESGSAVTIVISESGGSGSGSYSGASPTTIAVGGLSSGSTISGLSYDNILESILVPYVSPYFGSFSVSGQSTTVETGTTLSGAKTFIWSISVGSGVVPTIDIYDITAAADLLSGTPNDGTQSQTVTTLQLNSNGATQQWRGVGNNTSPSGTFNSSAFTVTARYYRFFGASASSPANSAAVRALPSSAFQSGIPTFTLSTGTTLKKFVVALPPSVTITSVIDVDALGADITSSYVLTGTVNVLDAGGTNRSYNVYEMNVGATYSTSHNHSITTS